MEFIADPTRLCIAALCGLAILLFLIIKGKLQPLIAILISALSIGLIAGMPVSMIVDTVNKGMGETLKGIALLVGLGSMFGAILEISGGAERVALTMMRRFGEKRAPWALGLTGMVVSIPVPIVVVAFLIAIAVRVSVGSATVAMTMAAGIVAAMPVVATLPPLHLACIVMAIAGGSTAFSHFNDSGFWLVKSLCSLDEKTTFKTWTMMETLVGVSGFLVALLVSLFV